MSLSRSKVDPARPADHVDSAEPAPEKVGLGAGGWARWMWRQLTSMRTALVLLLLLAIAAVPGSIVPQRGADPNGVTQYFQQNPNLAPILDGLQLFDVYTSVWFTAIYLLLFISLIGCVIPRLRHHLAALRARPPKTPQRLSRLAAFAEREAAIPDGDDAAAAAENSIARATADLRRAGYRVQRYDADTMRSVSAERGYLRETGNLVFHIALVGVLVSVGIGGGFTYTGQRVVVEETTFVNSLNDYSSFAPGRFVNTDSLTPYTVKLDAFDVTYQPPGSPGAGQAGDFIAHVTTQLVGGDPQEQQIRVNHPLEIAGDRIYLLGNGYAPTISVRNANGDVVFRDTIPFLPQDRNLTSVGVVKIADGLPKQLGMAGFFYPTQVELTSGAFSSAFPALLNPVLTLNVYVGDLGINDGTPRSVFTLDTSTLTQLTGGKTGTKSIELTPGATADLPDGLGTVTFEVPDGAQQDPQKAVARFVSLSIHHDAAAGWVLLFASIAVAGLLLALFVPRRRLWVKATPVNGALRLEYAGLARGDDPALTTTVTQLADRHQERTAQPSAVD